MLQLIASAFIHQCKVSLIGAKEEHSICPWWSVSCICERSQYVVTHTIQCLSFVFQSGLLGKLCDYRLDNLNRIDEQARLYK